MGAVCLLLMMMMMMMMMMRCGYPAKQRNMDFYHGSAPEDDDVGGKILASSSVGVTRAPQHYLAGYINMCRKIPAILSQVLKTSFSPPIFSPRVQRTSSFPVNPSPLRTELYIIQRKERKEEKRPGV